MKELLTITEQKTKYKIEYTPNERSEIPYQREILLREMNQYCLPQMVKDGNLVYEIGFDKNLDHFCENRPTVDQILDLLEALTKVAYAGEEAFLDHNRWYWSRKYWTWDPETRELRGIYIPDRTYTSDYGIFLNGLISHLMRCCLADHWQDEKTILFLHRLYAAAQDLTVEAVHLSAFIAEEQEKLRKPEVPAVIEPEVAMVPEKEGFWARIQGSLFRRRRVALPFG